MPTGPLTLLPIHAAGHYPAKLARDLGAQETSLLDLFISSYTPTLRALHHAITHHRPAPTKNRALIVAMNKTPPRGDLHYADLDHATAEARRIQEQLPAPAIYLADEQATCAAVATSLSTVDWIHFAGHAGTNPADPSSSHLALWDGNLAVPDISRLDLTGAKLAYLSACSTAHAGVTLVDEAIHISGAFQFAGFSHVVGTLWPILDEVAKDLAGAIYTTLDRDPEQVARALWHAVQQVRALDHDQPAPRPLRWAAHIHFGP